MLSRYYGIFILCIATVAGASFPPVGRWCSIWFTLSSVLLTLPEITHQWSLLGLNLWSNHAADKPTSNELFERDATRFSRGEYIANVITLYKQSEEIEKRNIHEKNYFDEASKNLAILSKKRSCLTKSIAYLIKLI